MLLNGGDKVVGILPADVLDAEVIHGQGKSNGARDVPSEALCVFYFEIPGWREPLFE